VGQVQVDHGGLDVLVAQQRLHGVRRGAGLGEMGREGMAQRLNTLLTNSDWCDSPTGSIRFLDGKSGSSAGCGRVWTRW
jgi:hypothetical protein